MDSKEKATRWLHVAHALLSAEPMTKEFQRLARQAVSFAETHLTSRVEKRHWEVLK
jgi:hypothetical protein